MFRLLSTSLQSKPTFPQQRMGVFGRGAVIIDVVINMGGNILKENKVLNACIAVAAFMAAFIFKVNAGIIILVAVAVGIINFLMKRGEVE